MVDELEHVDVVMPVASDAEALLERMLTASGLDRVIAWSAGIDAGLGGTTIIDTCNGVKFAWTWQKFRRHLAATDSVVGRPRIHTPATVSIGSLEDADEGMALGHGAR
jgi:hypothetical protein